MLVCLSVSVSHSVPVYLSVRLSACLSLHPSLSESSSTDRAPLELMLRDVSVGRSALESPVLHRQSHHESRQQQYHNEQYSYAR